MLNIICSDCLIEQVVMKDLIDMDRAKEFLKVFTYNNSFPRRKKFFIRDTFSKQEYGLIVSTECSESKGD